MITITNVTSKLNSDDEHGYELAINGVILASFRHSRKDGLAKCLERAAQAYRENPATPTIRV